jgi:precorrin-6B methylase 2
MKAEIWVKPDGKVYLNVQNVETARKIIELLQSLGLEVEVLIEDTRCG